MFKVIFLQFFETTHLHPLLLKNLTSVWFFFLCMTSTLFFLCLEFCLCILIFHYNMPRYGFKNKTKHFSLTFFFNKKKNFFFWHFLGPFSVKLLKMFNSFCVCPQIFFLSPSFFSFFLPCYSGYQPFAPIFRFSWLVSYSLLSYLFFVIIYFIWQCQILIAALRTFDLHVGSSSPERRTNPGPLDWMKS